MLSFIDFVDKYNNRLPHAIKSSHNKREKYIQIFFIILLLGKCKANNLD